MRPRPHREAPCPCCAACMPLEGRRARFLNVHVDECTALVITRHNHCTKNFNFLRDRYKADKCIKRVIFKEHDRSSIMFVLAPWYHFPTLSSSPLKPQYIRRYTQRNISVSVRHCTTFRNGRYIAAVALMRLLWCLGSAARSIGFTMFLLFRGCSSMHRDVVCSALLPTQVGRGRLIGLPVRNVTICRSPLGASTWWRSSWRSVTRRMMVTERVVFRILRVITIATSSTRGCLQSWGKRKIVLLVARRIIRSRLFGFEPKWWKYRYFGLWC